MQRVLVVDDSHLIHALIKRMLAARPELEVGFADNGWEALSVVASSTAPLLVLLDINMPVMDGMEFLEQIALLGFEDRVKVIIVSTEGSEEDVLRGRAAGAAAYLVKPFTGDALCDVIEGVLGHGSAMSQKRADSA
jgi:two-component system chemotaxis response regulator CheY